MKPIDLVLSIPFLSYANALLYAFADDNSKLSYVGMAFAWALGFSCVKIIPIYFAVRFPNDKYR